MIENLNTITFRNGDTIPQARTPQAWKAAGDSRTPAWCYFNNDSMIGMTHGKLYNWFAVCDPRGLAPVGWHIPSDEEWSQLSNALGGEEHAGYVLKSVTGWQANDEKNGNGNDSSGFNAKPGGSRFSLGQFNAFGGSGSWWTCTDGDPRNAWARLIYNYDGSLYRNYINKRNGFAVRCIKD